MRLSASSSRAVLVAVLALAVPLSRAVVLDDDQRFFSGSAGNVDPSEFVGASDSLQSHRKQQGPPPISPEILTLGSVIQILDKTLATHETPVALRLTSYYSGLFWNCVASFSEQHKDVFTKERPVVVAPDSADHTNPNRLQCGLQAAVSYSALSMPGAVEELLVELPKIGYNVDASLHPDVAACADQDVACLNGVASDNEYSGAIMGHILAKLAYDFSVNDGWNQLGTDRWCTANCRPYKDTTGYMPVNNPYTNKNFQRERWEPLLEDNGRGFFVYQEHVTPHIGRKALFRFLPESDRKTRRVRRPDYTRRRRKEAREVIERMAELDDVKKVEIEVFDDKLVVANNILDNFIGNLLNAPGFTDSQLGQPGLVISYERFIHFVVGLVAAEYDSVIIAWKEKVRYDLVRPTTVIKSDKFPDKRITTWTPDGVKTFRHQDFEAYIRVMPHSEYTSGSSCLFKGEEEYVMGYMEKLGLDPTFPMTFRTVPVGGSKVEPGAVPSSPVTLQYPSISEMADAGGQSRLNGGMHFAESVPAGSELCTGVGTVVADGTFALLGEDEG